MGNGSALYIQVAESLRNNILSEIWEVGHRLPPELELCEIFHVSRITIRNAIDILVHEGLVYRMRAKGTFVADWSQTKADSHFTLARSFTREMSELGRNAPTTWAQIEAAASSRRIAKLIGVSAGTPVMVLKRTRGEGSRPFAYFVTWFPFQKDFPQISAAYYGSFYTMLSDHGIILQIESEALEAISPTQELCTIFDVNHTTPLLKRTRRAKQVGENTFREYSECFYVGSKHRYYVDFS